MGRRKKEKRGGEKEGRRGGWEEGGRGGQKDRRREEIKTCPSVCVLPEVAQKIMEKVSSVRSAPSLWVVTEKAGRLLRCQIYKVCGGRD